MNLVSKITTRENTSKTRQSREIFITTKTTNVLKEYNQEILAINGSMNITRLGEHTTKGRTNVFDRWGILRRLKGSSYYSGLIPHDYVYMVKKNKKETICHLTLKGFFASLGFVDFDKQYLVSRYESTLRKSCKKNDVKIILDYIKNETTFLLYYNALQGLNWFRFRFLKKFIIKQRTDYKGNFNLESEIEEDDLLASEKTIFDKVNKAYGKAYRDCIFFSGYYDSDKVFREWKKHQIKKQKFDCDIKRSIIMNNYSRYWQEFFDLPKIDMNTSENIWFYLDVNGFDIRPKIINMKKKDLKVLFENRQNVKYLTSFMTSIRLN